MKFLFLFTLLLSFLPTFGFAQDFSRYSDEQVAEKLASALIGKKITYFAMWAGKEPIIIKDVTFTSEGESLRMYVESCDEEYISHSPWEQAKENAKCMFGRASYSISFDRIDQIIVDGTTTDITCRKDIRQSCFRPSPNDFKHKYFTIWNSDSRTNSLIRELDIRH